jgi:hypothetical protein
MRETRSRRTNFVLAQRANARLFGARTAAREYKRDTRGRHRGVAFRRFQIQDHQTGDPLTITR